MDVRIANYASFNVSANPSPMRGNPVQGTQAAKAAFQAMLNGGQQAASPTAKISAPQAQEAAPPRSIAGDQRGTLVDIMV